MKFVLIIEGFVTKLLAWFKSWEEPRTVLWKELQLKGWNTKHLQLG
jgi:hypothetical protein